MLAMGLSATSMSTKPVITLDVPKIRCVRQTLQGNKDNIYGCFLVVPISVKGPLKPHGVIIPLQENVCTGDIWSGLPKSVQIAVAAETLGVIITTVIYNKVEDVIYDRILNEACNAGTGQTFPWETIRKGIGTIPAKQTRIPQQYTAMKVAIETLKYFKMDDYLGSHSYSLFLSESAADTFPREFEFGERGSKYLVSIRGFFG